MSTQYSNNSEPLLRNILFTSLLLSFHRFQSQVFMFIFVVKIKRGMIVRTLVLFQNHALLIIWWITHSLCSGLTTVRLLLWSCCPFIPFPQSCSYSRFYFFMVCFLHVFISSIFFLPCLFTFFLLLKCAGSNVCYLGSFLKVL